MISPPDRLSRLPVGSSARINAGSLIRALPIDTRCCCPPDSSPGLRESRPEIRTSSASSFALARRSRFGTLLISSGKQIFSSTVIWGYRA